MSGTWVRAAAAGLLSLAVCVAGARAQDPSASADPAEWRLRSVDGREVTLGGLAGRPLVVNVWATWCLPCVAELRSFERLARALEGEDVGFVMVAPQDRRAVADWVRARRYALPFYVEETRMPPGFGLEAVPTTWILDREGRVVLRHRGSAEWDRPDVRALLRRLAAEGGGR